MSEYFSYNHLKQLKATEGRVLKNVLYHNWINKTNANDRFITVPETDEAGLMLADDFDGEKYKLQLLHEFGGKIDLVTENMNSNVLWQQAVNKPLHVLGVVHEGDNVYSNANILLDFGDEKLEIRPGIDGVIVEPYDE
jgi:hypothetical protein